ncbi:MAG: hypothetical protein C4327_03310 [Meiothermus sp.]
MEAMPAQVLVAMEADAQTLERFAKGRLEHSAMAGWSRSPKGRTLQVKGHRAPKTVSERIRQKLAAILSTVVFG